MMKRYKHVAVAGTFDHLHKGHRALLDKAIAVGTRISVGIATEKIYKNKALWQKVLDWETRRSEIDDYMHQKGFVGSVHYSKLSDIYGTALTDKTIETLIITERTEANGEKVNRKRQEKHLPPLKLITIPMVLGVDGPAISSERIRVGEIDREGRAYFSIFESADKLTLPTALRPRLRVPLGEVVEAPELPTVDDRTQMVQSTAFQETNRSLIKLVRKARPICLITVGDIVTLSAQVGGLQPDIEIIDLRTRRMPVSAHLISVKSYHHKAQNPAGAITREAALAVQKTFTDWRQRQGQYQLVVEGEEDLVALPAILLAPLGSMVLYGQWNLGVVAVSATEHKKKEIEKILGWFVRIG